MCFAYKNLIYIELEALRLIFFHWRQSHKKKKRMETNKKKTGIAHTRSTYSFHFTLLANFFVFIILLLISFQHSFLPLFATELWIYVLFANFNRNKLRISARCRFARKALYFHIRNMIALHKRRVTDRRTDNAYYFLLCVFFCFVVVIVFVIWFIFVISFICIKNDARVYAKLIILVQKILN